MNELTVGSLFAGIGGFDLGFERAGMRTAWQVELDPFCRRVLQRHFPDADRYEDVREVGRHNLEPVDVVAGGFPCQDLSIVGRGAGITGARSGLWSEYARIVGELRPRYVVVENVPALLARGFERVLGDLAALGYDAEWDCLPASAFGAPHRRDRIWVVAYPQPARLEGHGAGSGQPQVSESGDGCALADSPRDAQAGPEPQTGTERERTRQGGERVADQGRAVDNSMRRRHGAPEESLRAGRDGAFNPGGWLPEPDVGRVAHGIPDRVDRLASLGNALVPQIAEWIGRRIVTWEASA